jgi:hypothetical protein
MPFQLESLSDTTKTALLARLAHTLTICARHTYEIGTENVLDSRTLRAYNELLHRVTGSMVSHLSGGERDSLQSIIETIRSFGLNYGRSGEMNWVLQSTLRKTEKGLAE